MKNKLPKIVLLVSYLPYIFMLVYGVYSAIYGITFLMSTAYGWDGFVTALLISAIVLIAYIPIIPICVCYQLIFFLRRTLLKNMDQKKFFIVAVVISLVFVLGIVIIMSSL